VSSVLGIVILYASFLSFSLLVNNWSSDYLNLSFNKRSLMLNTKSYDNINAREMELVYVIS
jgi:hypothetical protein